MYVRLIVPLSGLGCNVVAPGDSGPISFNFQLSISQLALQRNLNLCSHQLFPLTLALVPNSHRGPHEMVFQL